MKILKRVLLVLFILYSIPCVLVYIFQEKLLFHPGVLKADFEYTFDYPFEEREFKMADGAVINALHFRSDSAKGVVLYFHGNAGDLSSWGTTAEDFIPRGYDLLIMDFRGFGKSTGVISEATLFSDGLILYDSLLMEYDESKITVYGRSMGTGIATYVAANRNPNKLILETPYYSMKDLAGSMYPVLPTFLLRYPLHTDEYLPTVNCPSYAFHGTADEIIYYGSSLKLKELVPSLTLITIEEGMHNNLDEFSIYHQELDGILNE